MTLLWTYSNMTRTLVWPWGGQNAPDQSRGQVSSPLTYWQKCSFQCSPANNWLFFFFFPATAHQLSISGNPWAISAKLLSRWFIPSLSWHMGIFLFPGVGLIHFPLLKSWHSCLTIYPAYQGTSEMAAQASGVSIILCSLVSSAKLLRVYSVPSSRSSMKL